MYLNFFEYSDADWAEVVDDKESTRVYIFFIADEFVSWCFKRQDIVALSSCESKYYVFFEIDKKAIWLRRLLIELRQISAESNLIWVDNQKVIVVVENSEFHRRMKHVDIKYHWVRQAIQNELITVEYIFTFLMIADDLIKSHDLKKFNRFLNLIDMSN